MEENTVRVESATPLPDRGASIFAQLERRYGRAARTYYEENPALLGGPQDPPRQQHLGPARSAAGSRACNKPFP